MKTDLMLVPSDTLVLAEGLDPAVGMDLEQPVPPEPSLFLQTIRTLYVAQHCSEGRAAWDKGCSKCGKAGKCDAEAVAGSHDADPASIGLKVGAPLLAREVAGRFEPLHPAPDDLVIDDKHRDFIFAQPAYLEPLRGDFVRHDRPGLRLLVPTSRRIGAENLGVLVTRKGVRTWAERKVERLTEGEHYVLARRLYELEYRLERKGGAPTISVHIRLRPGVGFVVPIEIPDARAPLALPATTMFGPGLRSGQVEEVQMPQADSKLKPARRWRLATLAASTGQPEGLPDWIDPKEWTTREPLPPGGKLFAIACRNSMRGSPLGGPNPARTVIPAGATFFIEFNDPVRLEPSAWMLAGGY